MKAEKVTVIIEMESLSIDVLRSMLVTVIEQVEQEAESGEISMQDGDFIKWSTVREPVNF